MASGRNQRGFSLIELLISLAIVAVLVGLLIPALSLARDGARTTVCGANLRQVGLGWQGYMNDHERFPAYSEMPEWRFGGARFVGPAPNRTPLLDEHRPINHYITGGDGDGEARAFAEVFRCPSDTGFRFTGGGTPGASATGGASMFELRGSSYRANDYLLDGSRLSAFREPGPLSLAEVQVAPSSLLVAADAQWHVAWTRQKEIDASWHRRQSAGNMVALDGSVRFVDFSDEPRDYTVLPMVRGRQ
jgi:prepilin-type N-terminal cleavage/methylation domain-containing protein